MALHLSRTGPNANVPRGRNALTGGDPCRMQRTGRLGDSRIDIARLDRYIGKVNSLAWRLPGHDAWQIGESVPLFTRSLVRAEIRNSFPFFLILDALPRSLSPTLERWKTDMKKFALIAATCAALAPSFAAAGNPIAGSSDPAPAQDDPYAAASSSAGSLGLGGAGAAIAIVAVAAALAANSSGGSTAD